MSTGKPSPYVELVSVIESLPVLLREARRARGLSIRAAAAELGVSFATVARIEQGEDGLLSNAVAVLRWLDQTPKRATVNAPTLTDPPGHAFVAGGDDGAFGDRGTWCAVWGVRDGEEDQCGLPPERHSTYSAPKPSGGES